MKLLQKKSMSTKVVHNKEVIEERKQIKKDKSDQVKKLRDALKSKLQE